ncbi:DUF871 domain-containing protein [uncultured Clostridium sp.]|uniref:DUF871 domain-containing protein n=1 Tax=uncultured Clostridium sp. TaxID=59620 RepID=UPI002605BC98|nr:MupG family TIM beta-alpha barrel fold protein [uncultured Clostridium sp.]
MRRLGISVYPTKDNIQEVVDYVHLAGKYGFKRIFTCLISASERPLDEVIAEFKIVLKAANEEGMEVIADLDPTVFKNLNASITDLKVFKDMGLSGIRLDAGFSGYEESIMSYNKFDLKIELNVSNGNKYLENILSYSANKENIYGCHNFYPHVYTGLEYEHFIKCSKQYKDQGIKVAAFVNSTAATHGPWPVSEGLCTLEEHRDMPITVQTKHLFATGLIDDVIIANAYASEEELKALSELNKTMITLDAKVYEETSELEEKIIFEEHHFNRGDISAYMIRSTQSRVKYKGEKFPPKNTQDIRRGDILIDSDLYTRYAGELQVAIKDMKNSGKTSIVGRISEDEIFLLDYITPWMSFGFSKEK